MGCFIFGTAFMFSCFSAEKVAEKFPLPDSEIQQIDTLRLTGWWKTDSIVGLENVIRYDNRACFSYFGDDKRHAFCKTSMDTSEIGSGYMFEITQDTLWTYYSALAIPGRKPKRFTETVILELSKDRFVYRDLEDESIYYLSSAKNK